MARTVKKARKVRVSRKTEGARRVSTRRMTATKTRGAARTRTRRATARARGAAESIQVTLDLRDVAGRLIRDPETFFTFRRLSDNRQIGDQLQLELVGSAVTFDQPARTGDVRVCEIDPKRFRFVQSPVFFATPGPPIVKKSQLLREPAQWTPRFTRWSELSSSFAPLKQVLSRSPAITLFRGAAFRQALVDAAYDGMTGEDVILAKTAMLNTFCRLERTVEPVSGRDSWFSFVTRLVAIGRERIMAYVTPEMEALVRQIHTHIDQFRADYERTPAENHRGNVPTGLQPRITSMVSIKSTHSKGNFQLTLTHLSNPDEVLMDADIDENGELLQHTLDLFKHKVSGGTHPHDIHEILVLQEGQGPNFELGYRLV